MRYWDSSALVPLIHEEESTGLARALLEEDPVIVTWFLTRLEVCSAIERLVRQGKLDIGGRREAHALLGRLSSSWHEVIDLAAVRARAIALVARHPLRAADAAQLATALLVADPAPSSCEMVCFDERMAEAAEREGMRVRTLPGSGS